MAIKIDIKDKKILYYLLQDSRQSLKTIGKKVGVSREFATYRIKRLMEKEIINNFTIIFNQEKVGYATINLYYKFTNINPEIKDEIIKYFVNHSLVKYVCSLEGIYDFQVELLMGDALEFESFLDEIRNKYYRYLNVKYAASWIRGEGFRYNFLLGDKVNKIESINWNWGHNITPIDNIDFKILSELSKDSRTPTRIIGENLDSTASIINNRIKKLIKNNIIVGYTINVDWSKIGYRWFHLRINVNDYTKKNIILQYIRTNPYLIRILKALITNVDIHFTFLLRNVEDLRNIIENLTSKFPNLISNYEFYSTFKIHKNNYMIPKLLTNKNLYNMGRK